MSSFAALDHAALHLLTTCRAPWLDDLMLTVSDLGARGFIWIVVAAIAFVFPARRADAWRALLVVAATYLVVDGLLKSAIWRDRPFDVLPDGYLIAARSTTSSFPSGHAAAAIAGAIAVSRLFPRARAVWLLLAALIVYSRVYIGVHFPFDAIAGAAVGAAVAMFVLGGRHAPLPKCSTGVSD
jgi:undecaprenyl-diphosphatase